MSDTDELAEERSQCFHSEKVPTGGTHHPLTWGENKVILTFFTKRGVAAPTEVPLAGEGVTPHNVIAGVALVCDSGSPHQFRVRCSFPAVLDLRQV